jgi:hypothetical protein
MRELGAIAVALLATWKASRNDPEKAARFP